MNRSMTIVLAGVAGAGLLLFEAGRATSQEREAPPAAQRAAALEIVRDDGGVALRLDATADGRGRVTLHGAEGHAVTLTIAPDGGALLLAGVDDPHPLRLDLKGTLSVGGMSEARSLGMRITQVDGRVDDLHNRMLEVDLRLRQLRSDTGIGGEVTRTIRDVDELERDLQRHEREVDGLRREVNGHDRDVRDLERRVRSLESRVPR